MPPPLAVFLPAGGGGLAAGVAAVLKSVDPSIHVVGCQPASADLMRRSVAAGHAVHAEQPAGTLAEGSLPPGGRLETDAVTLEPCRQAAQCALRGCSHKVLRYGGLGSPLRARTCLLAVACKQTAVGKPVSSSASDSGLDGGRKGQGLLALCNRAPACAPSRRFVDEWVVVDERDIAQAVLATVSHTGMQVEGEGPGISLTCPWLPACTAAL